MSEQDVILSISGLEKTYQTTGEKLTIFKDLNMQVRRGQRCVVVGKSGSGKSTLLNIIGGLDKATAGTVCVDGQIVSSMSEKQTVSYRRDFLGLVFQFHYLLKDFTALENVFLPAYMAGVPKKSAMQKAKALLVEVGLQDRLSHLPSELSGGERQRVAVARSLVNDPQLILADEPTGNLDPANAQAVGEMLFSLSKNWGKTLILVTHDMNLASGGERQFFIEEGRLTEKGAQGSIL